MKNNKYIITLFFILFSFFVLVPNIKAETNAYVKASALNIRSGASTGSSVLATIYSGETITITDFNKVSGTGCSDGWYKINYNEINGYVCSSFISLGSINLGYNTSNFTARVYATTLTSRSTPNANIENKLHTLINGTNVTVLETLASGNGCDDYWYKISYHDNKIGYVCSTYIIKKSDVTATDSEYEQVLAAAGFPSTYWPYLVYLHNKYPNWQFKAIKTNLNWESVIEGESGRNLIQNTTYDAYRTSDVPKEGSSWFEATDGVNAFYIDPRNFLTEKYIFMFENLSYDETTQGPNVVKAIFGASYLSEDEYVNYFINAGKQYNVSVAHLASRVVQEGGAKSTYEPITGTSSSIYEGVSLRGYYNYFNIGAREVIENNVVKYTAVVRGLAYAAGLIGDGTSHGRPWTTREKAIYGGAEFISSGYVNEGQYTLYFQKFNTSPTSTSSKYIHQYMTNVQAPSSEGSNICASYKTTNLINNSYVFAIPVYENMPLSVSLPTIGNVVNTLSSISINGSTLTEFDQDVVSYTYYLSNTVNSISINATPTSSTSIVEGIGDYNIDTNNTTLTIKVTSQTGDIKVYTINVIKVNDIKSISEILSNMPVVVKDLNITNIKESTTANNLISNIKQYGPSTTVNIKTSTGGIIQGTSALATGQKITIQSTSNEIKTYNIVVKGDTSGDGKVTILDLLQVQKDILNSKKLYNSYSLAGDTSGDGKITILDLLQIQKHILGSKKL